MHPTNPHVLYRSSDSISPVSRRPWLTQVPLQWLAATTSSYSCHSHTWRTRRSWKSLMLESMFPMYHAHCQLIPHLRAEQSKLRSESCERHKGKSSITSMTTISEFNPYVPNGCTGFMLLIQDPTWIWHTQDQHSLAVLCPSDREGKKTAMTINASGGPPHGSAELQGSN